jgi:hypothetical protein
VGYMPVEQRPGATALPQRRYAAAYERSCDIWDEDPREILMTLWAGNFSLRRDDALRVGLAGAERLDYHADRDFGIRCHAAGLIGVFDRSLRARHRYERTTAGLARDARREGRDLTLLHMLHRDVLGPLPGDRFAALLPPPVAALVGWCRRPRAAACISAGLIGAMRISGALRLQRWHEVAAIVLIRVEQQRGAIELRRERTDSWRIRTGRACAAHGTAV